PQQGSPGPVFCAHEEGMSPDRERVKVRRLFLLRLIRASPGTPRKETNKCSVQWLVGDFLSICNGSRKQALLVEEYFLKLHGDPEFELLVFSSRPRHQGHHESW